MALMISKKKGGANIITAFTNASKVSEGNPTSLTINDAIIGSIYIVGSARTDVGPMFSTITGGDILCQFDSNPSAGNGNPSICVIKATATTITGVYSGANNNKGQIVIKLDN